MNRSGLRPVLSMTAPDGDMSGVRHLRKLVSGRSFGVVQLDGSQYTDAAAPGGSDYTNVVQLDGSEYTEVR